MLDELERLERDATPGPLVVERRGDGVWCVRQRDAASGDIERHTVICRRQEDAKAHAAARNALPALLRVARAALEVEAAREARRNAYEMGVILRGSPGARESALAREDAMNKTDARLGCAEAEYRAAVAALAALETTE